jgi:inhibitor of KinA sporulation pathway (predicted exonuclease)
MFDKEFIFASCGDFDGNTLRKEATAKKLKVPNYLKRWINLKKVWPHHLFPDPESKKKSPIVDFKKTDSLKNRSAVVIGGMDRILLACGLELEGRHHSGLDDTKNLARCVTFLLEKGFSFT